MRIPLPGPFGGRFGIPELVRDFLFSVLLAAVSILVVVFFFRADDPPTIGETKMGDIKQVIYPHGGSRLWLERDGLRELIVSTYPDIPGETMAGEYAKAVGEFTRRWLADHNVIYVGQINEENS